MSIRRQLLFSVGVAVLLLSAQALVVAYLNSLLSQATSRLVLASQTRLAIDYASTSSTVMVEKFSNIAILTPSGINDFKASNDELLKELKKQLLIVNASIDPLKLDTKRATALSESMATLEEEYQGFWNEIADLGDDLDMELAAEFGIFVEEPLSDVIEQLGITNQKLIKVIDDSSSNVEKLQSQPFVFGVGLAVTIAVIMIAFGLFYSERIVSVIRRIMQHTEAIANGRLNIPALPVKSSDELSVLSSSVNEMTVNLRELVLQIQSEISDISGTSGQLSSIANSAKVRTAEQGERVARAEAICNQLIDTTADINERTAQTVAAADRASAESQDVQVVVDDMTEVTEVLQQDIQEVSVGMRQIGDQTENIVSILAVIESISEQTNLLALNAAIESARAGDAGRGFAVVASEVRTLANRTQESAIEIKKMIDSLSNVVEKSDKLMGQSAQSTTKAVTTAQQVNAKLSSIFDLIQEIDEKNSHIAKTVDNQIQLINEAKTTIDHIVEAESDAASESHSTEKESKKLVELGSRITTTVSGFETH